MRLSRPRRRVVETSGQKLADTVGDGAGDWSVPTTWEVGAVAEFHLTPQFEFAPEISYANISWSNRGAFPELEGDAWP